MIAAINAIFQQDQGRPADTSNNQVHSSIVVEIDCGYRSRIIYESGRGNKCHVVVLSTALVDEESVGLVGAQIKVTAT